MPDGKDGLEVNQFSVDIFDWIKIIFNHLGICTNGEQWRDALFPNYFLVLEVLGVMVQFEREECLHF